MANEFLDKDDLIVYTEGRRIPRMEEYARGNGLYRHGPLVVMIDENSASASEIVSGAVQDHDRGIIVGRRSFGKGLVQQAIPMEDGSEIRLTIARYHTMRTARRMSIIRISMTGTCAESPSAATVFISLIH